MGRGDVPAPPPEEMGVQGDSKSKFEPMVDRARSPEQQQLQKKQSELQAARDVNDGEQFYAALRDKKDVFAGGYKEMWEIDLKVAEAEQEKYQLDLREGGEQNSSLEESLKRDTELKKEIVEGEKYGEAERHMEHVKETLFNNFYACSDR